MYPSNQILNPIILRCALPFGAFTILLEHLLVHHSSPDCLGSIESTLATVVGLQYFLLCSKSYRSFIFALVSWQLLFQYSSEKFHLSLMTACLTLRPKCFQKEATGIFSWVISILKLADSMSIYLVAPDYFRCLLTEVLELYCHQYSFSCFDFAAIALAINDHRHCRCLQFPN